MQDGCSTKDYNQIFDLVRLFAGLFCPRSLIIFFDVGFFSRNRLGLNNSSFKGMLERSYQAKVDGTIIVCNDRKGTKQCFLYLTVSYFSHEE